MSTPNYEPDNADREQLVAYLDGELPPEEAGRVESRLAADPEAQRELDELATAWDALDLLPREQTSGGFSRTTVEMIAISARGRAPASAVGKRYRRFATILACVAVGALVGYTAVRWFDEDVEARLARDLPILLRLDQYLTVGDLAFVEALDETRLFRQPATSGGGVSTDKPVNSSQPLADSFITRADVVSMPPEERSRLLDLDRRYRALELHRRDAVAELHAQISNHPRSDELQATLANFHVWFDERIPPQQQSRIIRLPIDERIGEITRQRRDETRRRRFELSDSELAAASRRIDESLLRDMPPELARQINELGPADRDQALLYVSLLKLTAPRGRITDDQMRRVLAAVFHDRPAGPQMRNPRPLFQQIVAYRMQAIDDEELARYLIEGISENQRDVLTNEPSEQLWNRLRLDYLEAKFPDLRDQLSQPDRRFPRRPGDARPRPSRRDRRPGDGPDGPPPFRGPPPR